MNDLKNKIQEMIGTLLSPDNELMVWAEESLGKDNSLYRVASIQIKAAEALNEVIKVINAKTEFDMTVEANSLIPRDIEEIAEIAAQFDASHDPFLQKQAAVIDQLLLNFAQKGLRAQAESEEEKELAKIRAEQRDKAREDSYQKPREIQQKEIGAADMAKAIKDQVKEYRPLEASLSTRYCPNHPGVQVRRIGDSIYQCAIDKTIYNYKEGFTTDKGNKVPGTDVSNQTQQLGERALEQASFSTRESELK